MKFILLNREEESVKFKEIFYFNRGKVCGSKLMTNKIQSKTLQMKQSATRKTISGKTIKRQGTN